MAEIPDPYKHRGLRGYWSPLGGPCVCLVCCMERPAADQVPVPPCIQQRIDRYKKTQPAQPAAT